MNKKIKSIMAKAMCDAMNGPDPDGDMDRMYIPYEFANQFAKLIIAECVNICKDADSYRIPASEYAGYVSKFERIKD